MAAPIINLSGASLRPQAAACSRACVTTRLSRASAHVGSGRRAPAEGVCVTGMTEAKCSSETSDPDRRMCCVLCLLTRVSVSPRPGDVVIKVSFLIT